jgi:hypothetical protein
VPVRIVAMAHATLWDCPVCVATQELAIGAPATTQPHKNATAPGTTRSSAGDATTNPPHTAALTPRPTGIAIRRTVPCRRYNTAKASPLAHGAISHHTSAINSRTDVLARPGLRAAVGASQDVHYYYFVESPSLKGETARLNRE